MSNIKYFLITIYISTIFVTKTFAARPLVTDDIGTVSATNFELETGYDICNNLTEASRHCCAISLKHGITAKMDIGITLPYQLRPEVTEKLGATVVGTKFVIIDNFFSISLSNALGERKYTLNSIFSKNIGLTKIHVNAGYDATGNLEEKGEFCFACACEYCWERLGFVFETFGNSSIFENWTIGTKYSISDNIAFDIAYNSEYNNNENLLTFGVHYEF